MKKILLTAALFVATMAASAQTLTLSTYSGTNVSNLNGQVRDVKMSRSIFKGWNTISLPFAMTEAQIDEHFGSDCRLEKFVGVETTASATTMLFQDVKAQGIEANTPYILYYTGETKSIPMLVSNATLVAGDAPIAFNDLNGMTVTMRGVQKSVDSKGLYGILAKDNDEASFVNVSDLGSLFYATRCYVEVSNIDNAQSTNLVLATRHLAANQTPTGINAVENGGAASTTYNIAGQRVNNDAKGIKIQNHKKYAK